MGVCLLVWLKEKTPTDKVLDLSKLKGSPDDKIDMTEEIKICSGRVENTVGKADNADYHNFLLNPLSACH